jgi:DNA ligase-1
MDKICNEKGEGVMLKDPNSKYEGARSFNLLKVKRFEDAEAVVLAINFESGDDALVRSISVREKDGTEFKV